MLTIRFKSFTLEIENKCSRCLLKGGIIMTANEKELMKLIFEDDNPEEALLIVADIIFSLSAQHESSQEPFAV